MNDDELYELAKERIANDNGKRYSQEEIMEEFEIDEDDDFYEEKPFDWTFIEFLLTWDVFKKAYDKLLKRVKEIEPTTRDLYVYNCIYSNMGKGRTDDCLYEPINDEYDLCYSPKFKQTLIISWSKEEREERKNA
jgi:hypothetical protein